MRNDEKYIREQIQAYLSEPEFNRSIEEGALLLLKMNRNQTLYRNIVLRPEKHKEKLFYELGKWIGVEQIVPDNTHNEKTINDSNQIHDSGKRKDHDLLPDAIKQCYTFQAELHNECRSLHEKLKLLEDAPEEARKPVMIELFKLNSLSRKLWEVYDHFKIGDNIPNDLFIIPDSEENGDDLNSLKTENKEKPTEGKKTEKNSKEKKPKKKKSE